MAFADPLFFPFEDPPWLLRCFFYLPLLGCLCGLRSSVNISTAIADSHGPLVGDGLVSLQFARRSPIRAPLIPSPVSACVVASRCSVRLQVFGVFICVLRVFSDLHYVRHAGLAQEGRAG